MVVFQSDVPSNAGHRGNGLELVDDVAWDEIDVIVAEFDFCVPDALATELV